MKNKIENKSLKQRVEESHIEYAFFNYIQTIKKAKKRLIKDVQWD